MNLIGFEELYKFVDFFANLAAVAGAVISVGVFKYTVKREQRCLTIEKISKFRENNSKNIDDMNNDEKLNYLREIEFICTGINNKLYDFKILQKMSGKRLLGQYQKHMKSFVASRRIEKGTDEIWCEYEKVMQRLECHYCSKKNWFQKLFCQKIS